MVDFAVVLDDLLDCTVAEVWIGNIAVVGRIRLAKDSPDGGRARQRLFVV